MPVAGDLEQDVEDAVLLVLLEDDVEAGLAQGADELHEPHLVGEDVLVLHLPPEEQLRERARDALLLHPLEQLLDRDHLPDEVGEARALELLPRGEADLAVLRRAREQERVERVLVLEVGQRLAVLDLVERRLGDVEVPALDELLHLAVEEGEEEGADVAAVDVGVAHDDDAVVAQLRDVEVVGAHPGPERGDDVADLLGGERLVEARLLHVQDLAAQRAGSPGTRGRGPAWRSRRPSRPRPGTARTSRGSSPGTRRACRAAPRRRARPCGG